MGAKDHGGTAVAGRLDLAAAVADRLAGQQSGVTAAFLAGGLTAGLGNETSDVDIYLTGPEVSAARRQLAVERTRFDVHLLSLKDIEDTLGRLAGAESSVGGPGAADADVAFAEMLHGAQVVLGEDVLRPLRDRLVADPGWLARLTISRWLTAAHFRFEDFSGLRASGDADAALMVGRSLLVAAGKAVAAALGDRHPGEKWLWRQLSRSAPDNFPLSRFTGLLRADLGPSGVDELVAFAQTCLAAGALSWHGADLGRWPRWSAGTGPLRRVPGFLPRAFADGAVLTRPAERRVQLTTEATLVWALCDGVTESELIDDATAMWPSLTPQRCRELIATLTGGGLVH